MERNLEIHSRPKLTGVTKVPLRIGAFLLADIIKTATCQKNNESDSINKTIVVVPYRDRAQNLKLFLSPLHEHLMNQV